MDGDELGWGRHGVGEIYCQQLFSSLYRFIHCLGFSRSFGVLEEEGEGEGVRVISPQNSTAFDHLLGVSRSVRLFLYYYSIVSCTVPYLCVGRVAPLCFPFRKGCGEEGTEGGGGGRGSSGSTTRGGEG